MKLLLNETDCHAGTTKKRAPCDTFFRNHELDRVHEINRSCSLQNMSIYYHSGKHKPSTCYFLDYYNPMDFVHSIVFLKTMFGAWYKFAQNFLSPERYGKFYQVFHL